MPFPCLLERITRIERRDRQVGVGRWSCCRSWRRSSQVSSAPPPNMADAAASSAELPGYQVTGDTTVPAGRFRHPSVSASLSAETRHCSRMIRAPSYPSLARERLMPASARSASRAFKRLPQGSRLDRPTPIALGERSEGSTRWSGSFRPPANIGRRRSFCHQRADANAYLSKLTSTFPLPTTFPYLSRVRLSCESI